MAAEKWPVAGRKDVDFVPGVQAPEELRRAVWLAFTSGSLLIHSDDALPFAVSLDELGVHPIRTQFLGTLDGDPCFSAELPDGFLPEGWEAKPLRSLFGTLNEDLFQIADRASLIVN